MKAFQLVPMILSSWYLQDAIASVIPFAEALSSKRGLAYSNATFANLFENYPQVTWGYNWGLTRDNLSSSFEYLPMLWGDPTGNQQWITAWNKNASSAIKGGTTHLLAFNEPDINNLSPAQAAASYKNFMQPFSSSTVKLGAPAVTNGGPPTGLTWLEEFLGNCTSCTIDFVPIHWYCSYEDVSYFTDYIQQAHQAAGARPIWITEFQAETSDCSAPSTDAQQAQFMRTVLPWLDSLSYVQRYAYFGVFQSSSTQTYLINQQGSGLSNSGSIYATLDKVNSTTPTTLVN